MNKLNTPNLPVVISPNVDVSTQSTAPTLSFDTVAVGAHLAKSLQQVLDAPAEQTAKVENIHLSVVPVITYRVDMVITPAK